MTGARLRRWRVAALLCAAGWLPDGAALAQERGPVRQPVAALEVTTPPVEPARGLIPPGLLRYKVPEPTRPYLAPYLATGALLLVADEYALRVFRLEPLLADRGAGNVTPAPVYRVFSALGDPSNVALALIGLYALGGSTERSAVKVGGLAYVNALSLTAAGKYLTGKERPFRSGGRLRYHGPNQHYTSFPSAHASGTASLAHVLAHYYPDGRVLWYALSGAAGISRIGMANHWPSDVWLGWGVGITGAEGALRERERIEGWRPW